MRRLVLSAVAICGVSTLYVVSPARSNASCAPTKSTILQTFGEVLVYRKASDGSVHACRSGVGDMRLARNGFYEGFGGRRAVAVRGNEVVWVQVSRDDGIDGDVPVLNVVARDFGSKKERLWARANGSRYAVSDAGIPLSAQGVPAIVVAANRSVAWIACDRGSSRDKNGYYDRCANGPRSVWLAWDGTNTAHTNDHPQELARGAIKARSLRLDPSGRLLSWRQDGQLHRVDVTHP